MTVGCFNRSVNQHLNLSAHIPDVQLYPVRRYVQYFEMMVKVFDWTEIADNYTETLLLGNGASIAIDASFSYRSLKETASEAGLITESVRKIFEHLNTQDFELVLNVIQHAHNVNQALDIVEEATNLGYREVRAALVGAVRMRHTSFETAEDYLLPIANFLKRFQTVLPLNYDLIVYWAMMAGNASLGNWFKDCFVNGLLDEDWKRMQKPYGAKGVTLVFYPHGNLVLTTSIDGSESKVVRTSDGSKLLNCVLDEWESGNRLPLFVSEGETKQKERAIQRSPYLNTVYNDVMRSLGSACAVYGWSASDNDDHILKRLCARSTNYLAFSVHRGSRTDLQIEQECVRISQKVRALNQQINVQFYWSDSANCWMAATEN